MGSSHSAFDDGDRKRALQGGRSWPEVSKAIATLQIPSFVKMGVLESHGGSMRQKRGPQELVRARGPGKTRGEIQGSKDPTG